MGRKNQNRNKDEAWTIDDRTVMTQYAWETFVVDVATVCIV
jgi:hypothetical protein